MGFRRPGLMTKVLAMGAGAVLLGAGLEGCGEALAPDDFVKAYQEKASVREERAGYAFITLYQSPEYLAAQAAEGPLHRSDLDSARREFGRAYYVALSIRAAKPTGGEGDLAFDPAGAKLAEGGDAFAREMERLRSGLRDKVFLEAADGRIVHPYTYMLNRASGGSAGDSFLFAFPTEAEGKAFPIVSCRIVVQEFGLNAGTVRHPLRIPSRLRLKVET